MMTTFVCLQHDNDDEDDERSLSGDDIWLQCCCMTKEEINIFKPSM